MGIETRFVNWGASTIPLATHQGCSPALHQLRRHLAEVHRMYFLGCAVGRPIRGGSLPSAHSWGAALDMGYAGTQREQVARELVVELVAYSSEWGLQAIHDYVGSRIWRAGRTPDESEACTKWWKAQKPDGNGMGSPGSRWLHLEVTPEGWNDSRSARQRGVTS